jgi:DNA-binding GntR family transcriptional regulator
MPLTPPPLSHFSRRAGKARVVAGVIHGLLHGRWQGGERLTEATVTQIFAVSRTPAREGLLELAGMGMVQLRRNCGAVLQPFGPAQLSEIYAVRMLLEAEAARLAAGRIPAGLLAELSGGFDTLRRENRPDEDWELDQQLHTTIALHSGNMRLAEEIGRYTLLVQTMREAAGHVLSGIQSASILEHLEILRTLKEGDTSGASEAMQKHLQQAERSAVSTMRSIQSGNASLRVSEPSHPV